MSRSSLPPVSKSTFRIEAQGPPPNVEICHLATQFGSVIVVDASLARGRTGGKEEVPARGGVTSAILEVSQRLASAPLGADEKRQKARAKETTCRRQAGAGLRIKTRQDLGGNQIGRKKGERRKFCLFFGGCFPRAFRPHADESTWPRELPPVDEWKELASNLGLFSPLFRVRA